MSKQRTTDVTNATSTVNEIDPPVPNHGYVGRFGLPRVCQSFRILSDP